MKVYISGPITGVDDYIENFHSVSKKIAEAGHIPVDPCTLEHAHDKSYEAYMKEDIKALLDCDCIYMLSGWKGSPGARMERAIAKTCKITEMEH